MKRIGILGAGNIAGSMAATVEKMSGYEVGAVASRSLEKAEKFAEKYNIATAYGSYEELARDGSLKLIYIATPHSHHAKHMRLCIEAGRNVLCEKAFTANLRQAEEIFQLAKKRNVLVAEAMWTRYMPSKVLIRKIVEDGMIGDLSSLEANLGYPVSHLERMQQPELAGGALLDLGVYPINFAFAVFGSNYQSVTSTAVLNEYGVDRKNSITLLYPDGKMAVLHSNYEVRTNRLGAVYGSKGYLEIQNINNCEEVRVFDSNGQCIERMPILGQISGYEYEVAAAFRAIEEGKTECEEMPHAETLRVMKLMDELRKSWGVSYPCD